MSVATAFLFSNVIAAHAIEKNFWEARREFSKKLRGGSSSSSPVTVEGHPLIAQLPKAVPVGWGGGNLSSPSNAEGTETSAFEVGPKTGDWLGRLVTPYGHVNDVYISPIANAPMIVHIQDAHGIEEAQKNIAGMMGVLQAGPHINLVGLEGASGSFNVDPLRHIASAVVTEAVADFFLEKGLIAGPEFAGLTLSQPSVFYGVEDNGLYKANIQALKEAYKIKPALQDSLTKLDQEAVQLKQNIFSDRLKTFDRHFEAYKAEREKLGDYVRYLVKEMPEKGTFHSREGIGNYPNVQLLVNALDQEDGLDFQKVEIERRLLVETLVKELPKTALEELVAKSVDHRAGRLGYGDYNRYLKALCTSHNVRLEEFKLFSRYISYVLSAEKINVSDLLEELDRLETAVVNFLAKTPAEKLLMDASRDLALLRKLVHHEMSVTDWLKYEKRRLEILDLDHRLAALSSGTKINFGSTAGLTAETLKAFEDFCSYAVQRNVALAGNLLGQMAASGTKAGVLVAGGFHTAGLTHILRQKRVSYVVVSPKISKIPKENNYLDVLARDPIPLEKLIAGERISLAQPIHLAEGEVRELARRVLFSLSGNKNPTVGEIREAALEGAKGLPNPSVSNESQDQRPGTPTATIPGMVPAIVWIVRLVNRVFNKNFSVDLDTVILKYAPRVETILVALATLGFTIILTPIIAPAGWEIVINVAGWIGINWGFAGLHRSFFIKNQSGQWVKLSPKTPDVVNIYDFGTGEFSLFERKDWGEQETFYTNAIRDGPKHLRIAAFGVHSPLLILSVTNPSLWPAVALTLLLAPLAIKLHQIWNDYAASELGRKYGIPALTIGGSLPGAGSDRGIIWNDWKPIIIGSANFSEYIKGLAGDKVDLENPSFLQRGSAIPPNNGMNVSNAYWDETEIQDIPQNVMTSDEIMAKVTEEKGRLSADPAVSGDNAALSSLQEALQGIKSILFSDKGHRLMAVARVMAALVSTLRKEEPDRYILHFARDLGYNLTIQNTLAQLKGEATDRGGAFFLNRAMMGTFYGSLGARIGNVKGGPNEIATAAEKWFLEKIDEGNPDFFSLAKETKKSLEEMKFLEKGPLLLMDTGLRGTMPWFVYGLIRYYDKVEERPERDMKVLLVQSTNSTPEISASHLGPIARMKQRLMNMVVRNDTMLNTLENLGDEGYHPVRFNGDPDNPLILSETTSHRLYAYFLKLVFMNMAVEQNMEETAIRDLTPFLNNNRIIIPAYILSQNKNGITDSLSEIAPLKKISMTDLVDIGAIIKERHDIIIKFISQKDSPFSGGKLQSWHKFYGNPNDNKAIFNQFKKEKPKVIFPTISSFAFHKIIFFFGYSKKNPYGAFGFFVGILSSMVFFLLGIFAGMPVDRAVEAIFLSVVASSALIVSAIGYGLLLDRFGNKNLAPLPLGETDVQLKSAVELYLQANLGIQVGAGTFKEIKLFDQMEEVEDINRVPGSIVSFDGHVLKVSVGSSKKILKAPVFLGQLHFNEISGTLYVKRSLAREPSILLSLGAAHIRGKMAGNKFPGHKFINKVAREVLGNLYELDYFSSPFTRPLIRLLVAPILEAIVTFPIAVLKLVGLSFFSKIVSDWFLKIHGEMDDTQRQRREMGLGWIVRGTWIGFFAAGILMGIVYALGIPLPGLLQGAPAAEVATTFVWAMLAGSLFGNVFGGHALYNAVDLYKKWDAPLTVRVVSKGLQPPAKTMDEVDAAVSEGKGFKINFSDLIKGAGNGIPNALLQGAAFLSRMRDPNQTVSVRKKYSDPFGGRSDLSLNWNEADVDKILRMAVEKNIEIIVMKGAFDLATMGDSSVKARQKIVKDRRNKLKGYRATASWHTDVLVKGSTLYVTERLLNAIELDTPAWVERDKRFTTEERKQAYGTERVAAALLIHGLYRAAVARAGEEASVGERLEKQIDPLRILRKVDKGLSNDGSANSEGFQGPSSQPNDNNPPSNETNQETPVVQPRDDKSSAPGSLKPPSFTVINTVHWVSRVGRRLAREAWSLRLERAGRLPKWLRSIPMVGFLLELFTHSMAKGYLRWQRIPALDRLEEDYKSRLTTLIRDGKHDADIDETVGFELNRKSTDGTFHLFSSATDGDGRMGTLLSIAERYEEGTFLTDVDDVGLIENVSLSDEQRKELQKLAKDYILDRSPNLKNYHSRLASILQSMENTLGSETAALGSNFLHRISALREAYQSDQLTVAELEAFLSRMEIRYAIPKDVDVNQLTGTKSTIPEEMWHWEWVYEKVFRGIQRIPVLRAFTSPFVFGLISFVLANAVRIGILSLAGMAGLDVSLWMRLFFPEIEWSSIMVSTLVLMAASAMAAFRQNSETWAFRWQWEAQWALGLESRGSRPSFMARAWDKGGITPQFHDVTRATAELEDMLGSNQLRLNERGRVLVAELLALRRLGHQVQHELLRYDGNGDPEEQKTKLFALVKKVVEAIPAEKGESVSQRMSRYSREGEERLIGDPDPRNNGELVRKHTSPALLKLLRTNEFRKFKRAENIRAFVLAFVVGAASMVFLGWLAKHFFGDSPVSAGPTESITVDKDIATYIPYALNEKAQTEGFRDLFLEAMAREKVGSPSTLFDELFPKGQLNEAELFWRLASDRKVGPALNNLINDLLGINLQYQTVSDTFIQDLWKSPGVAPAIQKALEHSKLSVEEFKLAFERSMSEPGAGSPASLFDSIQSILKNHGVHEGLLRRTKALETALLEGIHKSPSNLFWLDEVLLRDIQWDEVTVSRFFDFVDGTFARYPAYITPEDHHRFLLLVGEIKGLKDSSLAPDELASRIVDAIRHSALKPHNKINLLFDFIHRYYSDSGKILSQYEGTAGPTTEHFIRIFNQIVREPVHRMVQVTEILPRAVGEAVRKVIGPILTGTPYHYVKPVTNINGNTNLYDESQGRAQIVSNQITNYLGTDPNSSTDQLARRAAFVKILTETLAAGATRKAIPDHLALKIQGGAYWNLSPQDQLVGLTSLLAVPALSETLETISKRYPATSAAPSLPEVSISVNSRMAVNLAGYSNKPNDEKASSRTSVLSLLGTGQNILILLGGNETPSDVSSLLGIEPNDARTALIEFRTTNGGDNHANVLKTYRETDGNIPLADVALNWNNDNSLDNTGLAVVTFKDFELTIQNALQALIALMRSA